MDRPDIVDRFATRKWNQGVIPSELVHRYRHDPAFHRLVRVLIGVLSADTQVGGADVREASVVAEEIVREARIQQRIDEIADPIIPIPEGGPDG